MNVLVRSDLRCMVADFGLSRFLDPGGRKLTSALGTPQWMAPEVITHSSYGQAADVYAFGILCWEVAARRPPHETMSKMSVVREVPLGLRPTVDPRWPAAVSALMETCWDADTNARPTFPDIVRRLDGVVL